VGPPPPSPPPPPPPLRASSGPAFADPTHLRSEPQPLPLPCGVGLKDEPGGGEGVTGVVGVGPLLCGDGVATDHKAPLAVRNSRGCGSGWRPVNVHIVPEAPSVVARQEAPQASAAGGAATATTNTLDEARLGPVIVALPASSITHPHGYVPDGPPSMRPGELRICGLTFHPELRQAVERLQAVWMQSLKDPLARTDPIRHQMAILGVDLPLEAPEGSSSAGAAAAAAAAAFRRHGLKRNVICNRLARMLG
ncbi:hypothetical protein Vafri_9631, partial [Volvox africanus]